MSPTREDVVEVASTRDRVVEHVRQLIQKGELKPGDRLHGERDLAVELQRGLVAIPAVCPASGGEGELDKAVWLEAELRRLGLDDLTRCDAPDPAAKGGVRPNLIARLPGRDRSRTLWLMSHLDIVPPGDLAAWTARATPATCADAIATRYVVIAETAAGRIAGFAQLHPQEGAIEAVYVDPDSARHGIGRALVGALEADARARGLPGLVVEASLNSVPFYGALGYAHECWSQHSLGAGHGIACAVMSKRLGAPS